MQGITKERHVHMIDALLQLEKLLACEQPECGCLKQAKDHRKELETKHNNYEQLLEKLAEQKVCRCEIRVCKQGKGLF